MTNDEPIAIYTKPSLQLWAWVASGAIFAALLVYDFVRFPDRPREVVHAVLFAISIACFLAAHATTKWKATFYADRVEWSRAFRRVKRMFADDIAGFRRTGWGSVRLLPKRGRGAIVVPGGVLADVAWLDDVVDLDAAERDALRSAAASNPRFGATEAERAKFIANWPKRLRWLNAAGWIGGLWAMIWPQPYEPALAFLFLAPLIALAILVWARPLVNVDEDRDEPGEISVFGLYFIPTLALVLRFLLDFELMSLGGAFVAALVGGIALTVLIAWCDPPLRHRSASLAGVALLSTAYALGVLGHANVMLDGAPSQRFETVVVKIPGAGRYKTEITVGPWGDKKNENTIKMPGTKRDTLAVGDRICIDVHPGALGWRWYEATRCP